MCRRGCDEKEFDDLMVAYLTNAMLTTVTRREGFESWGVYSLFLTTTVSVTGPGSGIQT